MRLSILFAIALTIGLIATAPASAASVCNVGNTAVFVADDVAAGCPGGVDGASEVNAVSVSANGAGAIVFTDANPVTDGDGPGGCAVSGNTATCPAALAYSFNLGGGDDSAVIGAVANAGAGSTGGDGHDHLPGAPLGHLPHPGPRNH